MAKRRIKLIDIWAKGVRDIGKSIIRARDAVAGALDIASGRAESQQRREFLRHFNKQGAKLATNPETATGIINDTRATKTTVNKLNNNDIGHLYLFTYKAKWRDKLPYWDMFPLIFLVNIDPEHFLGLNLHYIPPKARAMLMDAINDDLLKNRYDDTKENYDKSLYSKITYQRLKAVSKNKMFAPCVKRYRKDHVMSPLVKIPGPSWKDILFLPLARWQKASASRVYRDSVKR